MLFFYQICHFLIPQFLCFFSNSCSLFNFHSANALATNIASELLGAIVLLEKNICIRVLSIGHTYTYIHICMYVYIYICTIGHTIKSDKLYSYTIICIYIYLEIMYIQYICICIYV